MGAPSLPGAVGGEDSGLAQANCGDPPYKGLREAGLESGQWGLGAGLLGAAFPHSL